MELLSAPIVSNIQGELFYNYGNPFQLTSLPLLIANILSTLLLVGALIVFICLLWGGWQWMNAGDNEASLQQARERLTHCLVGFAILAVSYAIAMLVQGFFGLDTFREISYIASGPTPTPTLIPIPPSTPTPIPPPVACANDQECWDDPNLGTCYVCLGPGAKTCQPNPGGLCELGSCWNPSYGICNVETLTCEPNGANYSCLGQDCNPDDPTECFPGTCVDPDGDGVGECVPPMPEPCGSDYAIKHYDPLSPNMVACTKLFVNYAEVASNACNTDEGWHLCETGEHEQNMITQGLGINTSWSAFWLSGEGGFDDRFLFTRAGDPCVIGHPEDRPTEDVLGYNYCHPQNSFQCPIPDDGQRVSYCQGKSKGVLLDGAVCCTSTNPLPTYCIDSDISEPDPYLVAGNVINFQSSTKSNDYCDTDNFTLHEFSCNSDKTRKEELVDCKTVIGLESAICSDNICNVPQLDLTYSIDLFAPRLDVHFDNNGSQIGRNPSWDQVEVYNATTDTYIGFLKDYHILTPGFETLPPGPPIYQVTYYYEPSNTASWARGDYWRYHGTKEQFRTRGLPRYIKVGLSPYPMSPVLDLGSLPTPTPTSTPTPILTTPTPISACSLPDVCLAPSLCLANGDIVGAQLDCGAGTKCCYTRTIPPTF